MHYDNRNLDAMTSLQGSQIGISPVDPGLELRLSPNDFSLQAFLPLTIFKVLCFCLDSALNAVPFIVDFKNIVVLDV